MAFPKLLLGGLIIIVAMAFLIDSQILELFEPYTSVQLNYIPIVPIHYNIKLISDIEENIFLGNCNISIKILQPTQRIKLYSRINYITDIMVIDDPPKFPAYDTEMFIYKPIKSFYDNEMHITEYLFTNELSSGHYILMIKFVNIITDHINLISFRHKDEQRWLAATYFDISGIHQMFPCLDESSIATFNITIEHHQSYVVLSNMPIQKIEIDDEGMALTHFKITPVMSPYLLAAVLTNLSPISGKNESVLIDTWCRMPCEFAHKLIENITLHLENEWKINHVAIPDLQDENIINLGLVLYREADIIYNENVDSIADKIKVARYIGHKVMQEWFYYYENPSLFSWLNKGLIIFFEAYVTNKILPNIRIMDLFVVQIQQESFHFDTNYTSLSNSSFESPRYIRASSVLRMLQHMVTEEIFWDKFRTYVRDNKLHPDDYFGKIWTNINTIFTQTSPYARPISTKYLFTKEIINSWTNQKHYPILNVTRVDCNDSSDCVHIVISNFYALTDYYVPITFTTQTHHNFNNTSTNILLHNEPSFSFPLGFKENGWIILNIQQIGYYRVNYDIDNWQKISNYLAFENYLNIHVLNRAQMIDDAFHFMITNQIIPSIFWNITNYLVRETDYVAWYPMFKALECMSSILPLQVEGVESLENNMRNIFDILFQKIKYEEISNEDDLRKCLREEAAKWACFFDSHQCKEKAESKLKQYLVEPETHKLLPWWREWTYCNGLAVSSDSIWREVYYMWMNNSDNEISKFLTCTENINIIKDYLNITKHVIVKSNNHSGYILKMQAINNFLSTIAKHIKKEIIFKYVTDNFEEIIPRNINVIAILTVIIDHIYSQPLLIKFREFVENHLRLEKTDIEFYLKISLPISLYKAHFVKQHLLYNRIMLKIVKKIYKRFDQIKSQEKFFQILTKQ